MAIVVLNINEFKAKYPAFNNLTDDVYHRLFDIACLTLNNTDNNPVKNADQRKTLLYLLMAHLAVLDSDIKDASGSNGSGGLVGRIHSATEGSVSISTEYATATQSSAWYLQTQYGALYWQLILPFRLFKYVPKRRSHCCG